MQFSLISVCRFPFDEQSLDSPNHLPRHHRPPAVCTLAPYAHNLPSKSIYTNIYVRCINNKFLVLVSLVLFSAVGFRFPLWLLGPANINNPTPNTPRWRRRHSRKSEANVEAKANRNRNRNRNQNSCGKDKLEIGSTVYSHANTHLCTASSISIRVCVCGKFMYFTGGWPCPCPCPCPCHMKSVSSAVKLRKTGPKRAAGWQ